MRSKKSFITSPKSENQDNKIPKDLITVVLLGENHGHRMKSYGPVPLIRLGEKTILEKQIDTICSIFENFEIIICAGFETEKTINFIRSKFKSINIRVVENQLHYNSNCCESTRLCLNNTMNDKVLICSGSILLSRHHINSIDFNQSCVLIQSEPLDSNFEIGVIENDGLLDNFSVGVKNKYWSEIVYLTSQREVGNFLSIVSNPDYKNRFLFEALNDFNKKNTLKTIQISKPSIKIDNIKTLKRIIK